MVQLIERLEEVRWRRGKTYSTGWDAIEVLSRNDGCCRNEEDGGELHICDVGLVCRLKVQLKANGDATTTTCLGVRKEMEDEGGRKG